MQNYFLLAAWQILNIRHFPRPHSPILMITGANSGWQRSEKMTYNSMKSKHIYFLSRARSIGGAPPEESVGRNVVRHGDRTNHKPHRRQVCSPATRCRTSGGSSQEQQRQQPGATDVAARSDGGSNRERRRQQPSSAWPAIAARLLSSSAQRSEGWPQNPLQRESQRGFCCKNHSK